jgi:hypothetical protein
MAQGFWIVGFVGSMVVAEMLALIALFEQRSLSSIENSLIFTAIFYGISIVAVAPLAVRVRAWRRLLPGWLAETIQDLLLLAFVAIALLATTGVISARVVGIVVAAAAFVLILLGRVIEVFGRAATAARSDKRVDGDNP